MSTVWLWIVALAAVIAACGTRASEPASCGDAIVWAERLIWEGRSEEALEVVRDARERWPDDCTEEGFETELWCLHDTGRFPEFLEVYGRHEGAGAELSPYSLQLLGDVYSRLGRRAEAIEALEKSGTDQALRRLEELSDMAWTD